MKKIMILAGGNDQIALIQELRHYWKNSVEIILIDQSTCVRAVEYADRFFPISTMDQKAVLNVARSEGIDYILTACGDQPLSTMAYVSACLGLPSYLTEDEVRDLTNKLYMKEKMVKNDIPTSKHICINEDWDKKTMPAFAYPLVVKPVDSNGSKGVKKVFNSNELDASLQEAFKYSISKHVIIEEFKLGEELSVDIYVEGTNAKLLSVTASKKIKENEKSFTIVQSYYPVPVKYDKNKVLEIAQQIVNVFKLKDTPLLVQMIVNEDEYSVLEFSARMGGGSKYKLIDVLSGVNIMKTYVEMVMGGKPKVTPKRQFNNAIMSYVYCKPGVFSRLKNFDTLLNNKCIYDYFVYKIPDSVIEKSDTSSDRVAGFLVVGDSAEEVTEKLKYANSQLQVLDNRGRDIMRHDLY
ncbi:MULTISPECIES: ATP-grasp domain-containing protein [Bacteroides]|uniref:ATP-grasp domain-containing protein n=1 Tax=Bacteroides TaxID=816 RepID=UPI00033EEBCF|nr:MULTISPECIES: ATP-grasp domain-containing protein [Bacteroides]UYU43898.1 ATP-grasp domain-containing protein [Bacteroides salyersiae]CCY48789.1 phosphoribosylglycinamide synthetase ATP-grasp (A) domain protein [Bacteroides sp. CAG:189]